MAGQQSTAEEAVARRIGQVVMLHRGGDREEARNRLLLLWRQLGADGDPLQRCTVAHFLAGTQDDPADELAWGLRALSAAGELGAEESGGGGPRAGEPFRGEPSVSPGRDADAGDAVRPPAAGVTAARALYPSLHLGLAVAYARLGRTGEARNRLRLARLAARDLGTDGHGTQMRAAIGRLERRLGAAGPGPRGGGGSERRGPSPDAG